LPSILLSTGGESTPQLEASLGQLSRLGKLLRSIDAQRAGDAGIGSAVERKLLDRELAELAAEWIDNPDSPRVGSPWRIR
jgi:hypothetical protein